MEKDTLKASKMANNTTTKANPSSSTSSTGKRKNPEHEDLSNTKAKEAKPITADDEKNKNKNIAAATSWSEEDEISLLKGLVEFHKNNNNNDNAGGFFTFINKSLKADITKKQLSDKVCQLKEKFEGYNDESLASLISKPDHDKKVFELSNMIWGSTNNTTMTTLLNEDSIPTSETNDTSGLIEPQNSGGILNRLMTEFEDYLLHHGLRFDLLEESERENLEKKWKKLKVAESKWMLKKARFESKLNELKLEVLYGFSVDD